ncbi:phosphopantetheine-binding protein [Janthinobacterium agaricidamnosum]|uniref:Putative acyl carrier protein n=1 Tax=Janthinobacterium agaricidamnosum NBRC 102515 = DSM 9628 TaxID=1349767 RepID=W0V4R5_9BURK|nr:phosphopantetheine-binding protein [Janthinobacterium agaricidamnosum]CDG82580.1 putative acyl carrier protein [Janthinobacterium agaricidamnosum NBRC 102515 = DSM 9628]
MQEFFDGLAEILEIDVAQVAPALKLADYAWDSLAIISTIALADDVFDQMLDGKALAACQSVADIVALIEPVKQA